MNTIRAFLIAVIALVLFNATLLGCVLGLGLSVSYVAKVFWNSSKLHYILFVAGYFIFFDSIADLAGEALRYFAPMYLSEEEKKSAFRRGVLGSRRYDMDVIRERFRDMRRELQEMRDIPLDAHMNIAGEDIHTNAYNNEYNNDAGIVPDTPPPPPPVVVAAVVAVVAEPTNRNATGLELRERREREIERGRVRGGGDYFMVS